MLPAPLRKRVPRSSGDHAREAATAGSINGHPQHRRRGYAAMPKQSGRLRGLISHVLGWFTRQIEQANRIQLRRWI